MTFAVSVSGPPDFKRFNRREKQFRFKENIINIFLSNGWVFLVREQFEQNYCRNSILRLSFNR